MAISASVVASINDGTNLSSYSTAAWTPTNNRIEWMFVQHGLASGVATRPSVSGNSLTWEFIGEYYVGTADGMSCFAAMNVGSVGTNGTTTANFGAQAALGCEAVIFETSGMDLPSVSSSTCNYAGFVGVGGGGGKVNTDTLPNSGYTAGDPISTPVQPLVSTSRCIGAIVISANVAMAVSGSWTELSDQGHTAPTRRMEAVWRSDAVDSSFTSTWSGTVFTRGMMVEILASPRLPAQPVNATVVASHRAASW